MNENWNQTTKAMKIRTLIAGSFALLMAAALPLEAAGPNVIYNSAPGTNQSKIWIEGSANVIHPVWYVKGDMIAGLIEVGPGFPAEPGQAVTPGKVDVQATNVFIRVRNLKSVEKDGRLYSDHMDNVMYDHFKVDKFPLITYHLTDLTLKEAPKSKDAPYVFDSKGQLAIGGITNTISMPVNILPLEGKKLKITGSPRIKMSDYKVGPVELAVAGVGIKSGDEVKLDFEWTVRQRALPRAAASK